MKKVFIKSNFLIGLLALTVALPIFVVSSAWLLPGTDLWSHFAQTLLPDLVTSTLILLIGVGIGVSILGTILAYLVVMVEFPGRAWLEWALFLPFAIPAYVLAFVYLGVFDYSGYAQVWLREYLGPHCWSLYLFFLSILKEKQEEVLSIILLMYLMLKLIMQKELLVG